MLIPIYRTACASQSNSVLDLFPLQNYKMQSLEKLHTLDLCFAWVFLPVGWRSSAIPLVRSWGTHSLETWETKLLSKIRSTSKVLKPVNNKYLWNYNQEIGGFTNIEQGSISIVLVVEMLLEKMEKYEQD